MVLEKVAEAADAAQPVVVEAVDVKRRFFSDEVLRGASLSLRRGELVALIGRSGSGKSTLLHILGGLDRDFTGSVKVFGEELATKSDRDLCRLRNQEIGFVFQAFHLLDHLSCVENVALPNAFSGQPLPRSQAVARAIEALGRVGLAERAQARPRELSGGQRQRVAIARALFFRPRLLLCDEPTGNLDASTGQHIIELFSALNAEGLSLLLVTHEPRVAEVATRIVRIEAGVVLPGQRRHLEHGPEDEPADGQTDGQPGASA